MLYTHDDFVKTKTSTCGQLCNANNYVQIRCEVWKVMADDNNNGKWKG